MGDNDAFAKIMTEEADIVKPIIRHQFLKDFILGTHSSQVSLDAYSDSLGMDMDEITRMVILKPSEDVKNEDWFFVRGVAHNAFGDDNVIISTTVCTMVLIVLKNVEDKKILAALEKTRRLVSKCYGYRIMSVYSDAVMLSELPEQYRILCKSVEYGFYTDENDIIRSKRTQANSDAVINPDYAGIEAAAKDGDAEKTRRLIDMFFSQIERAVPPPALAKNYCLELYVCLIRCCDVDNLDKYMKGIARVQNMDTLYDIRVYMHKTADEIAQANQHEPQKVYSSLINTTIRVIEENLGNENLSLRWLAGTILFTNVDYLGKLFKKETGQNFSHYVMSKRMELAKELILEGKKERIYEVAEKVGYGSNSQYFSQVFKKYTGISPLEYKEYVRNLRK